MEEERLANGEQSIRDCMLERFFASDEYQQAVNAGEIKSIKPPKLEKLIRVIESTETEVSARCDAHEQLKKNGEKDGLYRYYYHIYETRFREHLKVQLDFSEDELQMPLEVQLCYLESLAYCHGNAAYKTLKPHMTKEDKEGVEKQIKELKKKHPYTIESMFSDFSGLPFFKKIRHRSQLESHIQITLTNRGVYDYLLVAELYHCGVATMKGYPNWVKTVFEMAFDFFEKDGFSECDRFLLQSCFQIFVSESESQPEKIAMYNDLCNQILQLKFTTDDAKKGDGEGIELRTLKQTLYPKDAIRSAQSLVANWTDEQQKEADGRLEDERCKDHDLDLNSNN